MDDQKLTLREWLGLAKPFNYENAKTLGHFVGVVVIFITAILALALFVALGRIVIEVLSFGDTSNETEGVSIRDLGYVVIGAIGIPFAAWRTLVAQRQAKTAEQSHITDQISKAVEQLGTTREVVRTDDENKPFTETLPNIEVRIGGLLALERIKNNSPDDHIQVMQILCAYIRENMREIVTDKGKPAEGTYHQLRGDVEIALKVITRRRDQQRALENQHDEELNIDLSNTSFMGHNLSSIEFKNFDMSGTDMSFTNCNTTSFEGSVFTQSNFSGSTLSLTNFESTSCAFATFDRAECLFTRFSSTNLMGATFNSVFFSSVVFDEDCYIEETNFDGSYFWNCVLKDTGISQSELDQTCGNSLLTPLNISILPSGTDIPKHWRDAETTPEMREDWENWLANR